MALGPLTGVLVRERQRAIRDTGTPGEGHKEMEMEMGVLQSQARKCLEPPEAGRSKEEFSSAVLRGSVALLTPSFGTSGFQMCSQINLCLFQAT